MSILKCEFTGNRCVKDTCDNCGIYAIHCLSCNITETTEKVGNEFVKLAGKITEEKNSGGVNMDEQVKKKLPRCAYNLGVGCDKANCHCGTCGWNPEVERKRKEKIYAKRGLVYAN